MKIVAYEGVVENGCVRVLGNVSLPEKAKAYIVLPDTYEVELPPVAHIRSPRLADPSQADLFKSKVVEDVEEKTGSPCPPLKTT
jgi:hypothetical protein